MLDELVHVIELLRKRIHDHREKLQANEIRTRMALVDPLLQALGWDVADPSIVIPEYDVGEGRADYALLGPDGRTKVTVEAKRLGESLANHRMQMLNYANAAGIDYTALTDGNRWELYDVFAKRPLDERRILDIAIDRGSSSGADLAISLLLLWRPNLELEQPATPGARILGTPPTTPPIRPNGDTDPPGRGWTALSDYRLEAGTRPPKSIRFPGGKQETVRYWWQMVKHSAEWLVAMGLITDDRVPVPSGPKGYIMKAEGRDQIGKPFASPENVAGTNLQIDRHGSAAAMLRRVLLLLEYCGQDPRHVYVQQTDQA